MTAATAAPVRGSTSALGHFDWGLDPATRKPWTPEARSPFAFSRCSIIARSASAMHHWPDSVVLPSVISRPQAFSSRATAACPAADSGAFVDWYQTVCVDRSSRMGIKSLRTQAITSRQTPRSFR